MESEKSELETLLEKNAYGAGLNKEERMRARTLILSPEYAKDDCWVCKMSCPNDVGKAIYDTGLCTGHASYALATGK